MRRVQILLDEELDDTLEREATASGTSKSALIRRLVREGLAELPPLDSDPLSRTIGADDFDPAPVDEVVYE